MRYDSEGITEALRLRRRTPMLAEPSPVRGDVHIQIQRCKGCELCIECCPAHVLRRSDDFNEAGYHYPVVVADACVCCQACYTICPEFAIFATLRETTTPAAASAEVPPVTAPQRDMSGEVRQ